MKNLLMFIALAVSFQVSAYTSITSASATAEQVNNDPGFSFLRGHKQGKSAHALQWSMTSTAGIVHYEIQSTYEDPFDEYSNWTNEGTVVVTRANIVKFTHQSVTPGFISYRVIAVLSNGSSVVSGIYSITIE